MTTIETDTTLELEPSYELELPIEAQLEVFIAGTGNPEVRQHSTKPLGDFVLNTYEYTD